MRINTNVSALNTNRVLGQTNNAVARSIGRLSSGFRINRAADDAAGLAIANKFSADIRSLRAAQQNTTEATSMLQVAEGNATSISNILGRMKELATQAASYNSDSQTTTLDNEYQQLMGEITRIVGSANYQGVGLLDGSFNGTFQVGTTSATADTLDINLGAGGGAGVPDKSAGDAIAELGTIAWGSDAALSSFGEGKYSLRASQSGDNLTFDLLGPDGATVLGSATQDVSGGGDIAFALTTGTGTFLAAFTIDADTVDSGFATQDFYEVGGGGGGGGLSLGALGLGTSSVIDADAAKIALGEVDAAINTVNTFLGDIGAMQNRLEYASANIATTIENYSASESAIRDADMAFEMTTFTRNQIMQQAATAMLAQANMAPQNILRLLG
jgi:flagellin